MAIDYDAGSGRRGAYQNLARALQMKLEAENSRRAEDIRRQGLFGTGITQENLNSLARTGLGIAQFGQDRMTSQMAQATERFKDRQATNRELLKYYQEAGNYPQADMIAERMAREQGQFNDQMGKYRKKGILGSRFGGEAFTPDFGEGDKGLIRAIKNREQREAQKEIKEVAKPKPQGYMGSGQTPQSSGQASMMPEDEFGGRGTTPLMSQRMMPDRGMEGNPGAQQNMVPTTATMTGEALGPKTYKDFIKEANPKPIPIFNEQDYHDENYISDWKEDDERRRLMAKTKRFYDPAQFTTRY